MTLRASKTTLNSPLDRWSGVPLYHQIQQRLLGQIRSGQMKAGEPLPSIQRIAVEMGVSPMTARQAVQALCEVGVLYSRQGKGTFISAMKLERDFRQVLSFSEETKARGGSPTSRVLSFRVQPPSQETRDALGLAEEEQVFCLRRVRIADSLAMGIETSCIPVRLCPDLLDAYDPTTSLYQVLAQRYGINVMVTDEIIEVGKACAEEVRLLQIELHSPIFLFTRISFLENGTPTEHVKSVYRGDRYKVVNRLTRVRREKVSVSRGEPVINTEETL